MTRWQFSLRSLLFVTTIVAICLTFGIYFPHFMILLASLALVQLAAHFSADWLIRPANSSTVRLLAATIWLALGSLFFALSGREIYGLVAEAHYGSSAWAIMICSAAGGGICYYMAWRRIHN